MSTINAVEPCNLEQRFANASFNRKMRNHLEGVLVTTQSFKKNAVTRPYGLEMHKLVQPLTSAFPSLAEYDKQPCPPDRKKNAKPKKPINVPREYLCYHNPASVMMSEIYYDIEEARRCHEPELTCFDELGEAQYNTLLAAADKLSGIWDSTTDSTPYDMAKCLIVQVVLEDDQLREQVFDACRCYVEELLDDAQPLQKWRRHRKE